MADIADFIATLPLDQQALARAGGVRVASMDAIGREQFVQQAIIGQDPAMRACAVFALALSEEAAALVKPLPPPAPSAEEVALFAAIDAAFAPKKSNPEAKKEF